MLSFNYSNINLKYRVSGKGNPVFFLHGFLEDHSMWDTIYPTIEALGFKCFRFDLPGHGETNIISESTSMQFMAELIVAFCKKNDIHNPHIFGHSMGGYIGLEMAKLMPTKLTLVNANFWADPPEKKQNRNRVITVVRSNKNRFIDEAIPNLFAPQNRTNCLSTISLLKASAKKMSIEAICSCTIGLRDRSDNSAILRKQTVHIIHGQEDPIIPTEKLYKELSDIPLTDNLHVLKNCGHMSIWEAPVELINCMKMIVFT